MKDVAVISKGIYCYIRDKIYSFYLNTELVEIRMISKIFPFVWGNK